MNSLSIQLNRFATEKDLLLLVDQQNKVSTVEKKRYNWLGRLVAWKSGLKSDLPFVVETLRNSDASEFQSLSIWFCQKLNNKIDSYNLKNRQTLEKLVLKLSVDQILAHERSDLNCQFKTRSYELFKNCSCKCVRWFNSSFYDENLSLKVSFQLSLKYANGKIYLVKPLFPFEFQKEGNLAADFGARSLLYYNSLIPNIFLNYFIYFKKRGHPHSYDVRFKDQSGKFLSNVSCCQNVLYDTYLEFSNSFFSYNLIIDENRMLFKFYQFFLSIANVICGSEAVKRCDTNYLNMSDFELIYKLKAKLLVLHSKEALSEHVAAFFTQFFHDVDLLYTIIEKLNKINYQKSARKI